MERALDPLRLAAAMGTPTELPTSEELGGLLADVEVGLFIRQPSIPEELLATAWYLHGVASAEDAVDLYPPERRRAAWQVSAHVFDLALESEDSDRTSRLEHCFAAQVGYLRSGATPNAAAVHRRALAQLPDLDVTDVDVAVLLMGAAFLHMDWSGLRQLLNAVTGQLRDRSPDGQPEGLANTALAPVVNVAFACRALMRFLTTGSQQDLATADEVLAAVIASTPATERFIDARWVAAHLRTLAGELASSSVWNALPPDVPVSVRRAFTMGQPAVSVLWEPQLDVVTAVGGNSALDPQTRRIVLGVPTSSGKTLISQLFTLTHLASGQGDVCFVVPTRSLGREVRKDLRRRIRLFGRDVAAERPDWDATAAAAAAVEVMTPERLAHMLRSDTTGVLERFGFFIFDEAHNVGEGDRGFVVESTIALLHDATRSTPHRIMLMSAALGNRTAIRTWVDPTSEGASTFSEWRGPRRLNAVFTTEVNWNQETRHTTKSKSWPTKIVHDQHGVVRLRLNATGEQTRLRTSPIGTISFRQDSAGEWERNPETGKRKKHSDSTPNYRMFSQIITLVGTAGPVLIIRSTRAQTRDLAVSLAETLPPAPDAAALADATATRLGSEHPLAITLRKGVAYHHSRLPADVLDLVEDGVRNGQITYVVATTGIADGVNLPVRTVFIDEPVSSAWAVPLTPAQVINAVGRAGRACIESEGWAILVTNGAESPTDFNRLAPPAEDLLVESRLTTAKALEALSEFEALRAASADAIFEATDPDLSKFISFVWLVLNTDDELTRLTSSRLESALAATLAWTQLDDHLKSRWRALASAVQDAYDGSDPIRRHRWARASTSIGTARKLDLLADELADIALITTEDLSDPMQAIETLGSLNFFQRMWGMPEAPTFNGFYTARSGSHRQEIPRDDASILRDWLTGLDIQELSDRHLGAVTATDWRFEQLADYLTDRFENALAWMVSTVVEWANQQIDASGQPDRRVCPELGAYIRYGVGDSVALAVMQEGVRSRTLAHRIAQFSSGSGWQDVDELREGLRLVGPQAWTTAFEPTRSELLDLVDFVRDRDVQILGQLLSESSISVPLEASGAVPTGRLDLQAAEQEALFGGIVVRADGRPFGTVPARYQSQILALLELGWPYELTMSEGPVPYLNLSLSTV